MQEIDYYSVITRSDLGKKLSTLLTLSKSKFNRYAKCPYSFMLTYICDFKHPPTEAMQIGIDVHDFHNKLFDEVYIKLNDGNKLQISQKFLDMTEKSTYKQNIVQFYLKKWDECLSQKPNDPERYFFPVLREKMLEHPEENIHGIPDAVEIDFDENVRVVEVKTGKPSTEKAEDYKYDLLWYKLLFERVNGGKVAAGRVYFPYSNTEYFFKLSDEQGYTLLEEINKARKSIQRCEFSPKPAAIKCMWCEHNKICQYSIC